MAIKLLTTNQNNPYGLNTSKKPKTNYSFLKNPGSSPITQIKPKQTTNPSSLLFTGIKQPTTQSNINYGLKSTTPNSILGTPYQVNGGLRQGNNPVMGTLYNQPIKPYSGATTFPGYTPAFGAEQQAYVASQKQPVNPVPGSAGSINYDLAKGGGVNGMGYDSSKWGKTTTTTTTPETAQAIAEQTGLLGNGYGYYESEKDKADRLFKEQIDARNRALATGEIDPNQVYQDTLNQYQSQIDAINAIYNDQLTQSRLANAPGYKSRLDQNRIMQVMGGLVASPMGEAQTVGVQQANNQEQAAAEAIINDRREVALANIMGQVRKSQEEALTKKYEAQKAGSEAAIAEINARPAEKKRRISDAVRLLVAGGHDVTKMSEADIKSFVDGLDTSKGEFISAYKEELAAQQAEAAKLEKVAKAPETIETNQGIMQWDAKTNKWINTGMNPYIKPSSGSQSKMSKWEIEQENMRRFQASLETALDQNMKIRPQDYMSLKSDYIAARLGNAEDFDRDYSQHVYINPKDKQYRYTSSSYGLPAA